VALEEHRPHYVGPKARSPVLTAHALARSLTNSRRFTASGSRASDGKDSTPQYGRRLLRCGISVRRMSAAKPLPPAGLRCCGSCLRHASHQKARSKALDPVLKQFAVLLSRRSQHRSRASHQKLDRRLSTWRPRSWTRPNRLQKKERSGVQSACRRIDRQRCNHHRRIVGWLQRSWPGLSIHLLLMKSGNAEDGGSLKGRKNFEICATTLSARNRRAKSKGAICRHTNSKLDRRLSFNRQ
jgi:hypothetical protein